MENDKNLENIDLDSKDSKDETKTIEELKNEIKSRRKEEKDNVIEEEEDVTPEEIAEGIVQLQSEEELEEFFEENHTVDIAESFEELDDEEILKVFELMSNDKKARILEEADEDLQEKIIDLIDVDEVIEIFGQMSPDDIADILGNIDFQKSKVILENMKRSEANKLRELLGYEEDSAGGIMTTRYIALKETLLIKDVMSKIKMIAPKTEVIETIFVLNEKKELIGIADLRDILISPDDIALSEITDENVIYAHAEDDQEEVAMLVSKYDLNVIPVINKRKNMLGIITVDDIIDVIQEENTEDILKLGGVSEDENIDSTFLFSVKRRLPWLFVNLITAFIASTTVSLFSSTISRVVILAAAMPIVAGMGGNAGTQTLAVTIRGIALGELDPKDTLRLVVKELTVGVINGAVLGILTGFIMLLLHGNPFLGIIIFLAMTGNMALACTIGFLVPVTLKFLKIDPALASAVILTTFTDTCGFFMYLGLATLFINKLL